MSSQAQIAANRRNAQQSTGPRTGAGKSASRLNAMKSGLYADTLVIRGETPEALAQLTAEYYAEFRPVTPRQRDLVDTLVHNQWLIRRLRLTEADLYAIHFQRRDDDFEEKYRFKVRQKEHPLADAFDSLDKQLLRLQSRLNSLERSSRAALKQLRELQAVESEAVSDQIGFVPSIAETAPSEDRATLSPEPESPSPLIPDPRPLTPASAASLPLSA